MRTRREAIENLEYLISGECCDSHMDYIEEIEMAITDMKICEANNAGWTSVKDRLPEDDRTVLAVKQLKNGQRDMCLARCIPDYECYDVETGSIIKRPYWVCGGNNNIIYWMPLPDMPKEET